MLPDQRRRGMNAMEIEGLCFIFLVVFFSLPHYYKAVCDYLLCTSVFIHVCLSVCLSLSVWCLVGRGDGSGESPDCETEECVSTDASHPHTNHCFFPCCKCNVFH